MLQGGIQQANMIREKAAALSSYEVVTLRQQVADSEAARKAETTGMYPTFLHQSITESPS